MKGVESVESLTIHESPATTQKSIEGTEKTAIFSKNMAVTHEIVSETNSGVVRFAFFNLRNKKAFRQRKAVGRN